MCDNHSHGNKKGASRSDATTGHLRNGASLDHGEAHNEDHARWSRREFLVGMSAAAIAGTTMLGQTPVRAFGRTTLLEKLRQIESDRILVLIHLNGGNDGLNTVVPVDNDIYYNSRPQINIAKSNTIPVDTGVGLHPALTGFEQLYGDGNLAIVQNVGYPDPSLSHFRSTDVWVSGSSGTEVIETGWPGRYLTAINPDFAYSLNEEDRPEKPLAVQIGGNSSMIFQGPGNYMGVSLASLDLFTRLAQDGQVYDTSNIPDTTYGNEMTFVRQIANDSFVYSQAIKDASDAGSNTVEYPANNPLANNLAVVAQLIRGNLESTIYSVSLGGFDTHSGQAGTHQLLLQYLGDAINSMMADLATDNLDQRVLVMTYSEFGRRVNQNGSAGTDHGTAAPLFIAGGGVNGGMYGDMPDLINLDNDGNLLHTTDFRSLYATVLQDWFGLSKDDTNDIFGAEFEKMPFVTDPATPVSNDDEPLPEHFTLRQNYPNPFNPTTTISYTLTSPGNVRLRIFDISGKLIQSLVNRVQPAGVYVLPFDASNLPSGTYLYRLETDSGSQTRKMTLMK